MKVGDQPIDELEAVAGKDIEIGGAVAAIEIPGRIGRPLERARRRSPDGDDAPALRPGAIDRSRRLFGHLDLFGLQPVRLDSLHPKRAERARADMKREVM